MSPYVRTVSKPNGATAVQVVLSRRGGKVRLRHVGTAHDEAELALLKAQAELILPQPELDFDGDGGGEAARPRPKTVATRVDVLWGMLERAWKALGFDQALADQVFEHLALARIIEPTSKLGALRVLAEAGVATVSYKTVQRRLPGYATGSWSRRLASACAARARLGPSCLVLYDVTTLGFETHEGDGFRESGYSKDRKVEPQITVGLLADRDGFPLQARAFEGNMAETRTMVPVIREFMAAYRLAGVTVVADAGMFSAGNKDAIEAEGLSFVLGARMPEVPYQLLAWQKANPGVDPADGLVLVQPWPAPEGSRRRDRKIIYRFDAGRARKTLKGIDKQIAKAEAAVAGTRPVKSNKYVKLSKTTKSVNRELEAKARTLAGWKAYETNLDEDPAFIISAYHDLWHIERAFRMSKSDLKARPIFSHKRESIDAHLAVVTAALAVSKWIETRTGWTISKTVKTLRAYRTSTIRIGNHLIDIEPEIPTEIQTIINTTH
jgi:hypothetical protein